jgi:hypothetical protein
METKKVIKNKDLLKNKYDLTILEENVSTLSKKFLICTQILTADFCVKYILDLDIDSGSEDSYIFDKNYILDHQQHITEKDFDESYKKFYKKFYK